MRIRHRSGSSSAALVFTAMTLLVSPAHAQGSSPTAAESDAVATQVQDGVVRELLKKNPGAAKGV